MQSITEVEFYLRGTNKVLARVSTSHAVPRQGETVNINKVGYVVGLVQWAVDTPSAFTRLRACVELEPSPPQQETRPMSDADGPCTICGAYSARACEIEDEEKGIECPWLEVLEERNSALNAAIDDRVERRRHTKEPNHD